MFLENNLHHTKNETGVLIFISELEHFVEVIADRGINDKVAANTWEGFVAEFSTTMKKAEYEAAIATLVNACGGVLAEHVPATEQKNELPNHLILI